MKYTTEQLKKALEEGIIKTGDTIEIIEKKEKYFMPKKDEDYYFPNRDGEIDWYVYNDDIQDSKIIEHQDISATRKEAEFKVQKQKYKLQYKRYLLDNEIEPVNWEDEDQRKYYAYYYYGEQYYNVSFVTSSRHQGTIYTTREESIYEFAEKIGEDNFIKYILIGEYYE